MSEALNLRTIDQTMMSFSTGTGGLACQALVDDKALVEVWAGKFYARSSTCPPDFEPAEGSPSLLTGPIIVGVPDSSIRPSQCPPLRPLHGHLPIILHWLAAAICFHFAYHRLYHLLPVRPPQNLFVKYSNFSFKINRTERLPVDQQIWFLNMGKWSV